MLEIAPGSDRSAIRSAYARKLKAIDPETDPEAFRTLRAAYEAAIDGLRARDPAPELPAQREMPPSASADEAGPSDLPDAPPPEIVDLQTRIDHLYAALTGPGAVSDPELQAHLADLLAAPAMGGIGLAVRVEEMLATMLMETLPRSDGILLDAIAHFRWDDAAGFRQLAPDARRVLARIDEWRLIESLSAIESPYHAAWRALSAPLPRAPWRRRLKALRPGMAEGVAVLLRHIAYRAPGLRHSLHAGAVEWWETYLASPRIALGQLAAIPTGLLLAWLVWRALLPAPRLVGAAAAGLIALAAAGFPWLSFRWLMPLRARWQGAHGHANDARAVLLQGWAAVVLLLPFLALALPPSPWALLGVLLAAALTALWAHLAAWDSDAERVRANDWLLLALVAFAALIGGPAFDMLAAPYWAMMAALVALLSYARFCLVQSFAAVFDRIVPAGAQTATVAIPAIGAGMAAQWLADHYPGTTAGYRAVLTLGALGLLAAAAARTPRGLANAGHFIVIRIVLGLALLAVLSSALPPAKLPPSSAIGGQEDPLAPPRAPMESEMTVAQRVALAMERLRDNHPGIGAIRAGNPPLYARIEQAMAERESGKISPAQFSDRIDGLVNREYQAKLPRTSDALLAESLAMRIARLRALWIISPEACADESRAFAFDILPDAYRKKVRAHVFAVVAAPAVTSERGRPVDMAAAERVASRLLGQPLDGYGRGLKGPARAKADCSAKLALFQAMMERPASEVAATVVRSLKR